MLDAADDHHALIVTQSDKTLDFLLVGRGTSDGGRPRCATAVSLHPVYQQHDENGPSDMLRLTVDSVMTDLPRKCSDPPSSVKLRSVNHDWCLLTKKSVCLLRLPIENRLGQPSA
jgi:hypothetical protein